MAIAPFLLLLLAASPPPPNGQPPERVFISPSGEPFRGPAPFEAWFARADSDHDGRLTRAEFQADADAFFKRLDTNGDGRIDGFEINAYERDVAPELIAYAERGLHQPGQDDEPRRRDRHGEGPHGSRGGYLSLLLEPEPVSNADFDLDSRVTADEWRRATDRRFDMLDTAKAGALTREALLARLPTPPKPKR